MWNQSPYSMASSEMLPSEGRSALFDAVMLVATVAILRHVAKAGPEAVEILGGILRRLGVGGEFREPGLHVVQVLPDLRRRAGIAARLGILRKQIGHFARGV